jgi:hypothetical protein
MVTGSGFTPGATVRLEALTPGLKVLRKLYVTAGLRPSTPPGPGPDAGVPARDPTDANAHVPGGSFWYGHYANRQRDAEDERDV